MQKTVKVDDATRPIQTGAVPSIFTLKIGSIMIQTECSIRILIIESPAMNPMLQGSTYGIHGTGIFTYIDI